MSKLNELEQYAKDNYVPIIPHDVRNLLCETLIKYKPKKILEIGTAIGYSALVMHSCIECHIDTLEIDENFARIAKENTVGTDTNVINVDCKTWIEENKKNKYDFIFLDGPKGQYIYMYDTLMEMLHSGGVLFCDDVLYKGMVLGEDFVPHKKRTIVVNLRKFLDRIQNDNSVTAQIYDIDDGVAIIVKK